MSRRAGADGDVAGVRVRAGRRTPAAASRGVEGKGERRPRASLAGRRLRPAGAHDLK